jgi:hypothetical protein
MKCNEGWQAQQVENQDIARETERNREKRKTIERESPRINANSREFLNSDRVETTERTEEHGNGGCFASLGVPLCVFSLENNSRPFA